MTRILMVSKCPTHPTIAGNRWWILAQAKVLKTLGAEIHFLYVEERALTKENTEEFDEILAKTGEYWGDRFHYFHVPVWQKAVFNIKKKWFLYIGQRPGCDSYFPNGLINYVNKLDKELNFDICIVNYYNMTKLLTHIRIPKKAIFTHDNFTYKDIRIGCNVGGCGATADANTMAKAMQRSPHIFAIQDEEAIFFQQLSPRSQVYTVYSMYDYHQQLSTNNRNILFLSGSNEYNINGIRWFINDVFPLIRERFVDAKLLIGGAICGKIKELVNMEGVKLLGFVDNLADFYSQGDVAINPVYQGTGLKIKTFEAISYDKVTIVHPHSMEGIFHKEKAPLFASSKPEEWVAFLARLWNNPEMIVDIKAHDQAYLAEMNEFITNEYKRFLAY